MVNILFVANVNRLQLGSPQKHICDCVATLFVGVWVAEIEHPTPLDVSIH